MVGAMTMRVMVVMQADLTSAPRTVQKVRMIRRVRAVAIVVLGILLAGCATIQKSMGGWFGAATPTPAPQATPAAAAQAPRVYYAGVDGLKMYSDPSASSKVVGALPLHEKVTRTQLERGFAFVESAKSGTKGWVKNAQLIWRLPTTPTGAAPAAAEPQPEDTAAPAAETPQEPQAPEPTATAAEPAPTATPVPAAPARSKQTPAGVAPSIFDAY